LSTPIFSGVFLLSREGRFKFRPCSPGVSVTRILTKKIGYGTADFTLANAHKNIGNSWREVKILEKY